MAWDDAKRELVVEKYLDAEPTAETSVEIVKQIAEELGESVNGVRMILSKAEVYIKKAPESKASGSSKEGASKRVSKADQQQTLIDAITDLGMEPDLDIITRLSGKAATYLATVVLAASGEEIDEDGNDD